MLCNILYRARLEAVRRQAAVDGLSIDPWHLAAVLEGLRLRMGGARMAAASFRPAARVCCEMGAVRIPRLIALAPDSFRSGAEGWTGAQP
ncbi:MAG TPA: hypothetical protein VKI44_08955 [Acetobacteraceae bacterium]|nr:hypothetical protein [Acetobacteraceae bacterium]